MIGKKNQENQNANLKPSSFSLFAPIISSYLMLIWEDILVRALKWIIF